MPCHGPNTEIVGVAAAACARERLLGEGGDALAEQLDRAEGHAVDAEQLKAAAAAHAQRCALRVPCGLALTKLTDIPPRLNTSYVCAWLLVCA